MRRRAVTGAVVDALRGMGVRLVGLLGTLVTARLLTPYDFGLVAFGTTVWVFGNYLSDGGVGQALIRRSEPPTKSELQALVAFQLGLDLILVVVVGLVMLPFGLLGQVTTVIVLSLPLGAFRMAAYIVYERRLKYRPMAIVEIAETSVYYGWAIATISIGWGVWGLATAFIVRALAGLVLLLMLLPEGRVAPVPSWTKVRPLLSFGFRVQAVGVLHMLRDQGVNIAVATFGGVAVLGLWGVAWRIIQMPVSLLQALWRVSFPGMSRLVAAKEDVGSTIERVIGLVAIGTGVLVAPLAASASAWIHVLIGAKWAERCLGGPAGMLRHGVRRTDLRCACGLPLGDRVRLGPLACDCRWHPGDAAPPPGAAALPRRRRGGHLRTSRAALVECVFFVYAARRTTTFRIGSRLAIPVLLAIVSASCGWLVEHWIGMDLAGALASSAVTVAVFVGGLAAVHRADLADAWRLIWRGLRGVVATRTDARPQPKPATG